MCRSPRLPAGRSIADEAAALGLPLFAHRGLPDVPVAAVVHPSAVGREGLLIVTGGHLCGCLAGRFCVVLLGEYGNARAAENDESEATCGGRPHGVPSLRQTLEHTLFLTHHRSPRLTSARS